MFVLFFKQKTAYEMRISDWSSDVCSSDLGNHHEQGGVGEGGVEAEELERDDPLDLELMHRIGHAAGRAAVRASCFLCGESCLDHCHMQIGRASGRERVCPYV